MSDNGWIGVDLDGTLAKYDKWQGHSHVGEPVELMVKRVVDWVTKGQIVKIFTARVSCCEDKEELSRRELIIQNWLYQNVYSICPDWFKKRLPLTEFEITCVKDLNMLELWDDRAVRVIENTGIRADLPYGDFQ